MNRFRRSTALATVPLVLGAVAVLPTPGATAAPAPEFSVSTLYFKVKVGPQRQKTCTIVGDLYTPAKASRTNRMPAILTTNGFGGSKDDQAGLARFAAAKGYVVLSYSGLGFGGSGCQITLDDPDFDGVAGKQLISYLAGKKGIAFTDPKATVPAPKLRVVTRDGKRDPRVGMVGGSYGGAVQFATASVDKRLDTIIPIITWNDLSHSLGPNNAESSVYRDGVSSVVPGPVKLVWGLGFAGLGVVGGVLDAPTDPTRLLPCPNFATFVCPALVTAGATGFLAPPYVASLRKASVASYLKKVRIPTLLMQGQSDTLFTLNEGIATYQALKRQGTPVTMVWQSWGHSGGPAPGEIDLSAPDRKAQYQTGLVMNWLAKHLRDKKKSTGPKFSYFRDWVDYTGNARPAYAGASAYPVGRATSYSFSGTGELTQGAPTAGAQTFLTAPAGAPTSINPFDVLGGYVPLPLPLPETDLPGTFASWTTAPLTESLDVVGIPTARFRVASPTAALTQAAGPAGKLVLFVKIQDVAPDGTVSLIRGLEAPIRVPDVGEPVTVRLPAIVHRFAPGHRIRLVVAGGSNNFRSGLSANTVTISAGSDQTLTLPVVR